MFSCVLDKHLHHVDSFDPGRMSKSYVLFSSPFSMRLKAYPLLEDRTPLQSDMGQIHQLH